MKALPEGELSAQLTEWVKKDRNYVIFCQFSRRPSPSHLRYATSPIGRGLGDGNNTSGTQKVIEKNYTRRYKALQDSLKSIFKQLSGIKNIKLLAVILLLGILLCVADIPDISAGSHGSTSYERDIKKLCQHIVDCEVHVSVSTNSAGDIAGIVIIIDTVTPDTALKLTEMLTALYSVPSYRIFVTSPSG